MTDTYQPFRGCDTRIDASLNFVTGPAQSVRLFVTMILGIFCRSPIVPHSYDFTHVSEIAGLG